MSGSSLHGGCSSKHSDRSSCLYGTYIPAGKEGNFKVRYPCCEYLAYQVAGGGVMGGARVQSRAARPQERMQTDVQTFHMRPWLLPL